VLSFYGNGDFSGKRRSDMTTAIERTLTDFFEEE